ncbi:glycosyltransferase [Gammaproteobacteria bacterium]|nr:glycosyltransferase [Gammaproteobacteria bacterium]
MRVVQTIASTATAHGGTSRSVPALCDALLAKGVDTWLIAGQPPQGASIWPQDRTRIRQIPENRRLRQWGVTAGFRRELDALAQGHDLIVHDHGIWLASNHAVARWCRDHAVPRIVSPRGMLGDWSLAHRGYKKRLAWSLYQHADLQSADAFHVTSDQEADEVRALGFTQPIHVVANGIILPERLIERSGSAPNSRRIALLLSRLHPKKGISELLRDWAALQPADWTLRLVGPAEPAYRRQLEQEIAALSLSESVELHPESDEAGKWQHYASAELFVLPSYNENFGIVIAEAMAAGLPVITTRNTPWETLVESAAGWWIDHSELQNTLRAALTTDSSVLKAMGSRGRTIATQKYGWHRLAGDFFEIYSGSDL